MSYTVGSIIGPLVGGWLGANGDYYFAAKLAIGGSLLSVIITLFMPHKSYNIHNSDNMVEMPPSGVGKVSIMSAVPTSNILEQEDDNQKNSKNSISDNVVYGFIPKEFLSSITNVINIVWILLCTKVITSVGNSMRDITLPIILKDYYGFNEQSIGLSMSVYSAFNALVNGVLLAPTILYLGGKLSTVINIMVISMAMISLLLAIVSLPQFTILSHQNGLFEFLFLTLLLSMLQYVLSNSITSESTSKVKVTDKGTLLGLEHSLFAAARIIAPQLGVFVLKSGGISGVSIVCAIIFGSTAVSLFMLSH